MSEYVHIGKLVATFGVKGELILTHGLGKKTNLKEVEVLFVEEQKGSYLPYFISGSKAKDEAEMYVQFEGVNTKEAAARFVSRQAWLLENDFRKLAGKSAPIALLGYEVITDEDENLGPIEEVI